MASFLAFRVRIVTFSRGFARSNLPPTNLNFTRQRTKSTMAIMTAAHLLVVLLLVDPASAAPWIIGAVTSLLLPPAVRLRLGGEQDLQKDCRQAADGAVFVWARDATQGYEVAASIFQALPATLTIGEITSTVWFPAFTETEILQGLTQVINDNTDRLGGVMAKAEAWPKAPCHTVKLSWSDTRSTSFLTADFATSISKDTADAAAIAATEEWVDNTLCRLSLCPYTASLTRAAVGLESANVEVGPIVIRSTSSSNSGAAAAALLAATFWKGVSEIATTPERNVATSLLIAPSIYDDHFVEFVATCDELIEASVQVVGADAIVGRAWFHPKYCEAATLGYDSQGIVPGHALPASMVQGFVDKTILPNDRPIQELVSRANDAVRWTPHATINLLRRSQLTAAKEVEAAAANKKPNAIYARNVMKIIADDDKQQLLS
jgi:hypothetical protein